MFEEQLNVAKLTFGVIAAMLAGMAFANAYRECQTIRPSDVTACQNVCAPRSVQNVTKDECRCAP